MPNLHFDPKKHKKYLPFNKSKYKSKYVPIARSTWELAFCIWCDKNNAVTSWASEPIEIKYSFKGKQTIYYPDFIITVKTIQNKLSTYLIEIKPSKETIPPKKTPKKSQLTYLTELNTYNRNIAKWTAARNLCNRKGWHFKILTEKELFKGNKV